MVYLTVKCSIFQRTNHLNFYYMKKYSFILFASIFALLVACGTAKDVSVRQITPAVVNALTGQTFDVEYLDKTVRPQDDFFEFANGTWIAENPVPASESRWGSFNELDQANKDKLTKILEEARLSEAAEGTMDHILGNYYSSYIDMDKRNALGTAPIAVDIEAVEKINSKKDILRVIASQHSVGISTLFRFGVGQDLKDIDNHISLQHTLPFR